MNFSANQRPGLCNRRRQRKERKQYGDDERKKGIEKKGRKGRKGGREGRTREGMKKRK